MAGRPRIYQSVEELDEAIKSYFNPDGIKLDKPTVTGLALHLGFADKTTLYEYRDRLEYSYSIKKALTMIENYHELGLTENNVTGRIFALKNMGWKDKVETGFTDSQGKDVAPVQIYIPSNGRDNTPAQRQPE
jgi:hypothetical protein